MHGFVYRDGDARAVYYAGWSDRHPERGASIAIAVGEWGDDSTASDRVSIGLEAIETQSKIAFRVLGPEESPWGKTELLGQMLNRDSALVSLQLAEVYAIAEHIVRDDQRLKRFLHAP